MLQVQVEKGVLYDQDSIHGLSEALAQLSKDKDQKKTVENAFRLAAEQCSSGSDD